MAMNITGNVTLLKNTAVDSSGVAIAPTSLEYGQIAINYNAKDPCIFIKVLGDNGATSIQKFVGEAVIAKTLSDILGESAADLATLKDLIKQFEGSSSDVLTLVKNIDAAVKLKADTTALNAHKNSTSNPHSVTASQVGALGATATAVDSSKLGGRAAADYWHKANSNISTIDWACKALTANGFVKCSKGIGVNADERLSLNANAVGFQWGIRELGSNGFLYFDAKDGANDWVAKAYFDLKGELFVAGGRAVWNAGNSNLSTIDWSCKTLNAASQVRAAQGLISTNPSNAKATVSLDWLGNKARIRVGGEGIGSVNAFEIQGSGNTIFASFNNDKSYVSSSFGVGTSNPTHKFESTTSTQSVYAGYFYNSATDKGYGLYVRAGNNEADRIASFQDRGGTNAFLLYGDRSAQFLGLVSIGTASKTGKLNMYGDGGKWTAILKGNSASGNSFGVHIGAGTTEADTAFDVSGYNGSRYFKVRGDGRIGIGADKFDEKLNIAAGNVAIGWGGTGTESAPQWLGLKLKNYAGNDLFKLMVGDCSSSLHTGYFIIDQRKNDATGTFVRRFQITPYGDTVVDSPTLIGKGIIRSESGFLLHNGMDYSAFDKTGNKKRLLSLDTNNDVYVGSMDTGLRDLYIRHNGNNTIRFTGANPANTIVVSNGAIGLCGVTNPLTKVHIKGIASAGDTNNCLAQIYGAEGADGTFGSYSKYNWYSNSWSVGIIRGGGVDEKGFSIRRGTSNIDMLHISTGGQVSIKNNLVVKGEAVTYSQDGVEARTVAAASATRLADLEDVDLTGASDNFVLYRSNTTNANGDRVWKARSDAKSWSEISGKPTTFTPVDHNHIGGTYTTSTPSDRGLKTNILPLNNSLNTILSINPVSYNWTSEAMDRYNFKHHSSIGVIAQELEDIIPTAVMQMDEQYKAVDYVQIVPYLVGAVKQLNDELANKNIAIENARRDYKRAYGESVNLKKEVDALRIEVDQIKAAFKQNLI